MFGALLLSDHGMGNKVAIDLDMRTFKEAVFWRLVRWCERSGAMDFTVYVYDVRGINWYPGDPDSVLPSLSQYRLPPAARLRPYDCSWDFDLLTPLWELVPASIEKLEQTMISGFARLEARRRLGEAYHRLLPTERTEVRHFCVYRDGLPMLGIFEEQGPELVVFLRPEEVRQFRDERFGSEVRVDYNYDLERFLPSASAPN